MNELVIKEPVWSADGFTTELVENGASLGAFYVKADHPLRNKSDDIISLIISSCVKARYERIVYPFSVSSRTFQELQAFSPETDIAVPSVYDPDDTVGRSDLQSLNVSGGLDSCAMAALFGERPPAFTDYECKEAERAMNKTFDSYIVHTNARNFPFFKHSIGYYNIASIIRSMEEGLGYTANGKTLDEDFHVLMWAVYDYDSPLNITAPNTVNGVPMIFPVCGFTALGTQKIVHDLCPQLYQQSIDASVCDAPHKQLYIAMRDSIIQRKTCSHTLPPSYFILSAFMFVYYAQKLNIVNNPLPFDPAELLRKTRGLDLSFYGKYDRRVLQLIPGPLREILQSRLESKGVQFYTDEDYRVRESVLTDTLTAMAAAGINIDATLTDTARRALRKKQEGLNDGA
ncbi:MAG TPA: hypothetical protein DEQ02_10440 [Ruminococcaceae bacterium]|nr:hypothetical protein [Oscillospiraceae bacterium]